jgi:hypothetical protein
LDAKNFSSVGWPERMSSFVSVCLGMGGTLLCVNLLLCPRGESNSFRDTRAGAAAQSDPTAEDLLAIAIEAEPETGSQIHLG